MLDETELRNLVGHDVVDEKGKSIGYLVDIFHDTETGQPEWIGVLTGTVRRHHVLVPASGAERSGESVRVRWAKERVKEAPTYDKEDRSGILGLGEYKVSISPAKEQEAYANYGLAEVAGAMRS